MRFLTAGQQLKACVCEYGFKMLLLDVVCQDIAEEKETTQSPVLCGKFQSIWRKMGFKLRMTEGSFFRDDLLTLGTGSSLLL